MSIHDLSEKGKERLVDAFLADVETVLNGINREFNEIYGKKP